MESNKWLHWILNNRNRILLSGLYFLSVIVLIIGVKILPEIILKGFGISINVYRKIQLVWGISLFCIAIWKAIGYHITRDLSIKTRIIENMLLSTLAFIFLHRWITDMGATLSMQLCFLILLAICDVLQMENGASKKKNKLFIVMGYLVVGGIWGHCASGVFWVSKYSIFSHVFGVTVSVVLFLSLSSKIKILELFGKPVHKLLRFLELEEV